MKEFLITYKTIDGGSGVLFRCYDDPIETIKKRLQRHGIRKDHGTFIEGSAIMEVEEARPEQVKA